MAQEHRPLSAASGSWHEDELWLAALPRTVGVSRLFVRDDLRSWGVAPELGEAAELLVSELVTNAVGTAPLPAALPGSGPVAGDLKLIRLRLRLLAGSLFIEVWDSSPGLPLPRMPCPDAEHGWGLQLVDSMTQRWGFSEYRPGGKIVWCWLDVSGRSALDSGRRAAPPLPKRRPCRCPVPRAEIMDDPAVLRHVLAGLEALEV